MGGGVVGVAVLAPLTGKGKPLHLILNIPALAPIRRHLVGGHHVLGIIIIMNPVVIIVQVMVLAILQILRRTHGLRAVSAEIIIMQHRAVGIGGSVRSVLAVLLLADVLLDRLLFVVAILISTGRQHLPATTSVGV